MAFWDNLGKMASGAASKAMQKTQDFTETAKLNSIISDEEKRISVTYSQIGKLFVELHRGDAEEAFSELLEIIRDAEERISSCREQIQDMKRTLRCEKCGAEVPRDSVFCSACGAKIVREREPANTPQCEKCGAPITDWMRFCTVCGNPLQQDDGSSATDEHGCDEPQYINADLVQADTVDDAVQASDDVDANAGTQTPASPDDVQENTVAEDAAQPANGRKTDSDERTTEAPQSLQQTTNQICPHCGAAIEEGQLFCIECGNSL